MKRRTKADKLRILLLKNKKLLDRITELEIEQLKKLEDKDK